ncbi:MAG: molybdenum cofactor guanylyltransferase [Novosphingobium sp.]
MGHPRILGAVLAGGRSTRFGSDKALAELDGVRLIDHAVSALGRWCDTVVIVGRTDGPASSLPDWPAPDMGPLAGLAAALRHARGAGFDQVLTCGVDCPGLPDDLPGALFPAPAVVADQPVIGLWTASAAGAAEVILTGSGRHSMRALAEATGARLVTLAAPPANVNFPQDLAAISKDR